MLSVVLIHRFVLFFVLQGLIFVWFTLSRTANPWESSAAWWPVTATLVNFVSIALLLALVRREGGHWFQLINLRGLRGNVGRDMLLLLGVLALAAPIAVIPNVGLAWVLFGSADAPLGLFIQPLPVIAAWFSLLLFPLSIALAELPTYYGYAMPRLEQALGDGRRALAVAAFWHAAQHATLPFIPDWRFVVWRLVMFLPFAVFVGFVIRRRPRLLPYLMVVHGLLDFQLAWMVWHISVVS